MRSLPATCRRAEFSKARFCPKGLLLGCSKGPSVKLSEVIKHPWLLDYCTCFLSKFLFLFNGGWPVLWYLPLGALNGVFSCSFFKTNRSTSQTLPSSCQSRHVLTACADGVTRLFDAESGECQGDFRRSGWRLSGVGVVCGCVPFLLWSFVGFKIPTLVQRG